MGVDAVLARHGPRDKKTRRPTRENVAYYIDKGDRFVSDCEGTTLPMLIRVKPYGSLVLSSSEMPQFIDEVRRLGNGGAPYVEPLVALAEQCSQDPNLWLHLDGD